LKSYSINLGDGNSEYSYLDYKIQPEFSYEYSQDGVFTITVIAVDQLGNTYTKSKKVSIDYYARNGLLADFSLVKIAPGKFRIEDKSKPGVHSYYEIKSGKDTFYSMYYYVNDPIVDINFERNGKYLITQKTHSLNSKTITFDVNDLPPPIRSGTLKLNINGFQSFYEFSSQPVPWTTRISLILGQNYNAYTIIPFQYNSVKYQLILTNKQSIEGLVDNKKLFDNFGIQNTPGIKNNSQWEVTFNDDGWERLNNSELAEFEILEIEPVPQIPLISKMYDRAYWVRARFKIKTPESFFLKDLSGEVWFKQTFTLDE
jgi:hypothetical protein